MHEVKSSDNPASSTHAPTYAQRDGVQSVAKYALPEDGLPPDTAYRLISDELSFDANPSLNLASFLTTWMEPQAEKLMANSIGKNLIDQEEYPKTHAIDERLVNMTARLFNAPKTCTPVGTTTVGSSEAIMLGMLAHKRSWQMRRKALGQDTSKPNMVMGADVHTCWEKFARYFDVEARVAPMTRDRYTLDVADVETRLDENTIAVAGLAGTTFTGQMDNLEGINTLLVTLAKSRQWHIPMHIDAASGGFVLPFTRPDVLWDFRLSQVRSINVSNHKFGLVYAGLGTLVFRDKTDLPEDLVFHINYLGGNMPNYSLNFSRPSGQVIAQYYNFLRLGMAGYRRVMRTVMDNARHLAQGLRAFDAFDIIGDGTLFPVIVVKAHKPRDLDVFALARALKTHGWVVPAYNLPKDADDIAVLRIVVRESFSRDMVDMFLTDMAAALENTAPKMAPEGDKGHRRPIC